MKSIIIGGFVRDFLLKKDSKDIDIELYGIDSYSKLEKLLEEFGTINSVGKSFGVCKLQAFDLELDFSFPRKDSKISIGHKGFNVKINPNIDFKTATQRRDFTINAIGYDVSAKQILDPFHGISDLHARKLRAVDIAKFADDPLRVLRAVQFSARFDLTLDEELFSLCKNMIRNSVLDELPKERIFQEIKKLLLQSSKVSHGILLLKEIGAFEFFTPLKTLSSYEFLTTLIALDKMVSLQLTNAKTNITLMLSVLCYLLKTEECNIFLNLLTNDIKQKHSITSIINTKKSIDLESFSNYDVYLLATKVNIEHFTLVQMATHSAELDLKNIIKLKEKAQELNVLQKSAQAILRGKDLLNMGLIPSKEFSIILNKAYLAQIKGVFSNHKDALIYLNKELLMRLS